MPIIKTVSIMAPTMLHIAINGMFAFQVGGLANNA
jgi:hypothetical protein